MGFGVGAFCLFRCRGGGGDVGSGRDESGVFYGIMKLWERCAWNDKLDRWKGEYISGK